LSFDASESEAYRLDVPNAQVHIVDGGHFALDTAADEITALVSGLSALPVEVSGPALQQRCRQKNIRDLRKSAGGQHGQRSESRGESAWFGIPHNDFMAQAVEV